MPDVRGSDKELRDDIKRLGEILELILIELKIQNLHNEFMTDEDYTKDDIDCNIG